MSPIDLAIFISRVESICAEMGAILQRAAFSPNIKDRLDFSCALFDANGELFAQAAHIPVHLGSMAFAMRDIVNGQEWQAGDMLVVNDPFLGGTHLPDVTVIAPLFKDSSERKSAETLKPSCFVVNRAHHANIGAETPGSMPLSTSLEQEGLIIPPTLFVRGGEVVTAALEKISSLPGADTSGDFAAQMSANKIGLQRLKSLIDSMGLDTFEQGIDAVNAYGEKMAEAVIREIPKGVYRFKDLMDGDGFTESDIDIVISLEVTNHIKVDFSGTANQVPGNINCPISVAAAAVFYVFRCLLPDKAPNCAGIFRCIKISAPLGTLLNAERPAATAAGNVETSMRIVDVVLGALAQAIPDRIPAASQGTMNNVAMGSRGNQSWDYYETIGGGMGASSRSDGLSGVQCHMTNTLNTPIESLESHYPIRVVEYSIRETSGGKGQFNGGDGLVREFEFLDSTEVTLLTERRKHAPWGINLAESGKPGLNTLDGVPIEGKCYFIAERGQRLRIETPGGGGWSVDKRGIGETI